MGITLRSLRVVLENADPAIVSSGPVEMVTRIGLNTWKIGWMRDLEIVDGVVVGDLDFAKGPYGQTAREMFLESDQEPRLSSGIFGAFLTFI